MRLRYAKSFEKDIEDVRHNAEIRRRLAAVIQNLKTIGSFRELQGIRKIEGYENYYRLRVGDYRLGIKLVDDVIELIRLLHRKEIYRRFP
ncbi:MAG: type II toxin-antitoxin system RelE/ParE family toxin [Desulfoferrobacter sp.]